MVYKIFSPRIEHNIMTELVIPVEEAYQTKLDHLHREVALSKRNPAFASNLGLH